MRTVNFSEARNNLKSVLDRVIEDADVTIIHRRDSDDVVVMSLAEWNSWQETNYLMSSPANARRLREAVADMNAGKVEYHELIEPDGKPHRVQETAARYRVKPKAKSARPKTKSARTSRKRTTRRG